MTDYFQINARYTDARPIPRCEAMAVGFILVFFGVRREYRDALEAESGEPLPGRPRKVRIWDEEDA